MLRTIIAWPAPNAQNTGEAHGSALGDDEVAATKKILGFDPEQTFEVPDDVIEHTRKAVDRGKEAQADVGRAVRRLDPQALRRRRPLRADADPHPARRLGQRPAELARRPQGRRHPQGVRRGINAIARKVPELWGGSADLAESNNTTIEGAPSFIPKSRSTKMWKGDPYAGRVLHFGIREHGMGSILNGIAVHGGTRVFGATFLTFSDYMRPVGPAGRADAAAGHLRVDPRLHRARRGRTDPPAGRAPGRAAGDPRAWTSYALRDANETAACWQTVLEPHRPARRASS